MFRQHTADDGQRIQYDYMIIHFMFAAAAVVAGCRYCH